MEQWNSYSRNRLYEPRAATSSDAKQPARVREESKFICLNFSSPAPACSPQRAHRDTSEVLIVYMGPGKDSNKVLNVIKMALNEVRLAVSETVGL